MTSSGANDDLAGPKTAPAQDDAGISAERLYRAAKLYYDDNATQAAVATR